MEVRDLTVEVRDRDLRRVGQIAPEYLDCRLEPTYVSPGKWTVRLPAEHPMAAALAEPGSGIIVTHTDPAVGVLFSGPTDDPESTATRDDPQGMAVFTGTGDNVLLWQRIVYPTPDMPLDQQVSAYDVVSGVPGETAMQHYVRRNLGPDALYDRRVFRLTLEDDQGRGAVVTKSARFDVLGDLLAHIATVSGLGFRVVQVGDLLEFQTFVVRDRSSLVRLDLANGTLASQSVKRARPRMTNAIVAGQGEGADRTLVEITTLDPDVALYGPFSRWEGFLDQRQTDDPLELLQAGEEALADAAGALAVTAVPGDDTTMRYPQDWREGDTLAVVTGDQEPTAQVTAVTILVNASVGVRIGASIGDVQGWDPQAPLRKRQDEQDQRISHLERNLESAVQGNAPAGADLNDLDRTGTWLVDTPNLAATLANLPVPARAGYRPGSVGTLEVVQDPGTGRVVQTFNVVGQQGGQEVVYPHQRVRAADGTWGPWLLLRQRTVAMSQTEHHQVAALLTQPSLRAPLVVTRMDGLPGGVISPALRYEALTVDGVQWVTTGGGLRTSTPSWQNIPLGSGWSDYDAAWPPLRVLRLSSGIITCRGLAKGGAVGTVVGTLPEGHRPAAVTHILGTDVGNNGGSNLEVQPDGRIIWRGNLSASSLFVDVMQMQFPAADVAPNSAWTPITQWAPGWGPVVETDPLAPAPSYWIDPYGQVWLRGRVRKTTAGDPTADTHMFSIPVPGPTGQVHAAALAAQVQRFAAIHWVNVGSGASRRTDFYWKVGSPANSSQWVSLANIRLHPQDAVPEAVWRTMLLQNGWVQYGGQFPAASVWSRPDGLQQVRGLVRAGALGGLSTQMGLNDRTAATMLYLTVAANAPSRLTLEGNQITVQTGSNGWLSLDGVSYFLEG